MPTFSVQHVQYLFYLRHVKHTSIFLIGVSSLAPLLIVPSLHTLPHNPTLACARANIASIPTGARSPSISCWLLSHVPPPLPTPSWFQHWHACPSFSIMNKVKQIDNVLWLKIRYHVSCLLLQREICLFTLGFRSASVPSPTYNLSALQFLHISIFWNYRSLHVSGRE